MLEMLGIEREVTQPMVAWPMDEDQGQECVEACTGN